MNSASRNVRIFNLVRSENNFLKVYIEKISDRGKAGVNPAPHGGAG